MQLVLGIIATILFLLYSIYFIRIIKGNPKGFEMEILRSFADWIVSRGAVSRNRVWMVYWASLGLEIFYFYLVLTIIKNPFLISFTLEPCP